MSDIRRVKGHVLVTTMVALAVLMVVVAGAIAFTGTNRRGAASEARADSMAACAESARRVIISQLSAANITVAPIPLQQAFITDGGWSLPDNALDAGQSFVSAGHVRDGQASSAITTVQILSSKAMGAAQGQTRDLSNVAPASNTNGAYYRIVAKCTDAQKREAEVEFVFRFG